jgi:outer membrane protein, heavy metal efflux system
VAVVASWSMRDSLLRSSVILAVALLGACARTAPHASQAIVDAQTSRRLDRTLTWTVDSTLAPRIDALLTGEITADTAVSIALLANPDLRATFEELGIAQADVAQATLLRNPVLSLSTQPGTNTSFVMQGVGLVFPLIHALQQPLRRRVALAQRSAVEQRVATEVINLATSVQVAWAEAVAAREIAVLRTTIADATAASATTAAALHRAGNIPDLTLAGERAMAEQAAADAIVARAQTTVARQQLSRLLGRADRDAAWELPSRLSMPTESDTLSLATAEALALGNRTDLAAAYHDVVALARAAGLTQRFALLPDGELGMEWSDEPDGRFFGPALAIPIPIADQGRPAVAAARARWRQGVARYDAQRLTVLTEVRARHAMLSAARERALRIRRDVLPQRRTVVTESQKQFNAMNLSIFALLQARQGEIESAAASVDALLSYWTARAQLQRAVGGAFAPRGGPDVPPMAPPAPPRAASR